MHARHRFGRLVAFAAATLVLTAVVMAPCAASAVGAAFYLKWGASGTGNGQFNSAHNVTVDATGNVFVCDMSNNRIQKFSSTGTYISQWGSSGSGNGQFNTPRGISVDAAGNVYVADSSNNRIQKFSNAGVYISKFGSTGSGNGQFRTPHSIAFDASGTIYVSDTQNNRIQKFSSAGVYQAQFGNSGTTASRVSSPRDIVLDDSGNLLVADSGNNRVAKYSTAGVYQSGFGSSGSGNGQFSDAHGIALDASGTIFVSDGTNNNVQAFNSAGVFQYRFGSTGTADGQFDSPTGMVCGTDNLIYVADANNDRIQVFRTDGVAPVTTSDAPDGWQSADVTVTLTATDAGSGVNYTRYKLNSSATATYTAPIVISTEGTNTLQFFSVDKANNVEATKTATILVDKTAPDFTIEDVVDGASYKADVTPNVGWSESPDPTFSATLNGLPYAMLTPVTDEGEYTLVVTATDQAGNSTTKFVHFWIDKTAPDLTVTGVTDGTAYKDNVTPDAGSTDPSATLSATLNGDPYVLGTEVTAEGEYTLVVTATDPAGNETVETIHFVIDKTAPDLTVTGVTDGTAYKDNVSPDASSTDPSATLVATLNGDPYTLGTEVTDEGDYTLVVTATDPAGNETVETVHFIIDKTAPDLTVTGVTDGTAYRDNVTPDAGSTDPSATLSATLNGDPYVLGTEITEEGEYTLVVTATDPAGNETVETVHFIIDKTAPDLLVTGVAEGIVYYAAVTPQANSTDVTAIVAATLNGDPFVLGTELDTAGDYTLVATASDPVGNVTTETVHFSIAIPEVDPVVVGPGTIAVLDVQGAGTGATYAVDPDVTSTVPGVESVAVMDHYVNVAITPGFSGIISLPITVTDSGGSRDVIGQITVLPGEPTSVKYKAITSKSTKVSWVGSGNATGYAIYVNGKLAAKVNAPTTSKHVASLLGPSAKVEVKSLGGDGTTSALVRGTYVKATHKVLMGGIRFRSNSHTLTTKAKKIIKGWAKLVIAQKFSEVSIDGYTGRHGRSEAYYKKLSSSRAKAVKNYIVNAIKGHGLHVKYTWAGHGSKHPIASNKTLAGSIKNQRVEVTLR